MRLVSSEACVAQMAETDNYLALIFPREAKSHSLLTPAFKEVTATDWFQILIQWHFLLRSECVLGG